MSYSRNMPDWQQYNALQSGGSEAAKSGQNVNSAHLYVPNISPSSLNGLNLSSDCINKSQNDVINYSQRNYQPPNNTPSGSNTLVDPPLTSMVHMSNCVGHYGATSAMNTMMDDAGNVDLRNGSMAALSEEMAHRNQISLNGPVPRVMGPNMNVGNNMGAPGPRIPPANTVPSNRQGPYMSSCKGPCCVSDPTVNYQAWEKFTSYQNSNPYRENVRASGYAAEGRRYRNEMAYRKDSYANKDLIPPNSYHVDQRGNFSDYKYCKDPPVPRNYQPSTVLPNYPLPNYGVSSDYQKYAYSMKDYPRQGAMNSQNSGILKYPEHNVNMQEKYSPKQSQYQSGALLQKGLVVPSISKNMPSVQNPYLNPQFSRELQWNSHEKDTSKIQNPVPMHSTYPKYQLYQQKYAMQRFSLENHLRELSRIPGYQTHPKYQECILRYRELLRLQQTVDYQSAIQNTLTTANSSIPPINFQFDQNGVLINSNYLPGNFPPSQNPVNPAPNSVSVEKEQHVASDSNDLRLQHLPVRSQQEGAPAPNPEKIPGEVQYLNQKAVENPHCQEMFEALDPSEEEHKSSKSFDNKPVLDVRQFLANWDEAEEEEGANSNLPDVVLSNSTPIVVVEYGNVGLVTHGAENSIEPKTESESSVKPQEYFQKDQSSASLLQDCSSDLNQGIVYANKLNIKCVGEGIDGVPTIHIVENAEGEFTYNEKGEMEVPVGALPSLTETKECESSANKEASTNLNYKKLSRRNSDPKLQINPQDLSILPISKTNPDAGASNLKKQSSFNNEENHNSDDISLPDLTTSECTPISTTLNTPTHSDSEECSDQGVDLTTSTNPIELIHNSPIISFTQSPVKMDPYEPLKGDDLSRKSSQDGLHFDFQENNDTVIKTQISSYKKEDGEKIGTTLEHNQLIDEEPNVVDYSQVHSVNEMIPENLVSKDSSAFSSNIDVFSSEDQDKWCWNSIPLIPGEETEEPKMPAPPMEENYLTKIMKDSAPITSLNVLESDEEKTSKVDDMWLEVGCIEKGLDLSCDAKAFSNEKLYSEPEQKVQQKTIQKTDAEVSASVTKILKNIRERHNAIPNSTQNSTNVKRNPKGISIISEEIFNSTWQRNTENKRRLPARKMSDSFEREEAETFAKNLKSSHRSRSKSLELSAFRIRSKSAESLRTDDKEERLLREFKNLKRKRSIDCGKEESKVPKLSFEQGNDKISLEHPSPVTSAETVLDQSKQKDTEQKLPANENRKVADSDLEIKFRNSCDSSKPFEAIKIEINVSRSDNKTANQSLFQGQKCSEPDFQGNQEDPSGCGSGVCSGRNPNCRSLSKAEAKVSSQNSFEDLDKDLNKAGEASRIQGEERKESVIEYLGKGQHPKISKHGCSACETCKSLSFHKIDKEYICTHLDNRISKPRDGVECLKNPLEGSSSTLDCLSNRLKSIAKSKPIEDLGRKSKLQELKHFRKLKCMDNGYFSGYENSSHKMDKIDVNESLELLPCTSEFSGFRSSQATDLLNEDLLNTSDDAKHFVIKNTLNCDSNSFDEIPFKIPEKCSQSLKSNLLDCEDSLSPKGYLNPLFSSLEDVENLNEVPVYTTKDGKITYSPNPRFTYRTLLMEAREKESRSHFDKYSKYSSTSQEKRSSKTSEKRTFSNKTDLKPPKKSLAKRFATQELEKSYQRYLSHKESKSSSFSKEPMVIKTIKNYSAFDESISKEESICRNESQVEREDQLNNEPDKVEVQIEQEVNEECLEEKIARDEKDPDEASRVDEKGENQIDDSESQVSAEIRSPSPGVAVHQVVPVTSSVKDSTMEADNLAKDNTPIESKQDDLKSTEDSVEVTGADKVQNSNVDFNDSNLTSQPETNLEKEIDIEDSTKEDSELELVRDIVVNKSNLLERRKSTTDVESERSNFTSERRRSEGCIGSSVEISYKFSEYLKKHKNRQVSISIQKESLESGDSPVEDSVTESAVNLEMVENTDNAEGSPLEGNIKSIENGEIVGDIEKGLSEEVEAGNDEIETAEDIEKSGSTDEVEEGSDKVPIDSEPRLDSENSSDENEKEIETSNEDRQIFEIEEEEREDVCLIREDVSSSREDVYSSREDVCSNRDVSLSRENVCSNREEVSSTREDICSNRDISSSREDPVLLSPAREEDDHEIIVIEDDDIFIIEPKEEVSENFEVNDKSDDSQEVDSEKRKELNARELKLPINDQMEEELVTSQTDLTSKSDTSDVITKESESGEAKTEETEVSIVDVEILSNVESVNSPAESQQDVPGLNQSNQGKSAERREEEIEISSREDCHPSDLCQEVEIISEIIEQRVSEDSALDEVQDVSKERPLDKSSDVELVPESSMECQVENEEREKDEERKELELRENCEREYLRTKGLSFSEDEISTEFTPVENAESVRESTEEKLGECLTKENNVESNQSIFQADDLPLFTEKNNEKDGSESVFIDESCFEVDPPTLEVQKELSDCELLNSPKSSDSNQFDKMPDVTLEENMKRESHLRSGEVKKLVPKLVIRKIETNRSLPVKAKSADANMEPSVYRKVPKMIIRNAKSRPATPTIEEIPEVLPLSSEESNVIKVKIRLDDINKNESYMFTNEESRIPKMKIKLEDKLPKVVIENLDIRSSQDLQRLVPKVKIKKLKNFHSTSNDEKTNSSKTDVEVNNSLSESREQSSLNSDPVESTNESSVAESEESRNRIPKLKIKKDLRNSNSSNSRKRHGSDASSQVENKRAKRSSKEEVKQDRRFDSSLENSMNSSDCQCISEKIPKVIIKRTSPTAEFKCEVSNDQKNSTAQDSSLQPQVVLQRSWILDCMAKELRHVNIALKLAIAKNGSKASVRGKSNSSKIQWEQFIRSLKKQKELSKSESDSKIFPNKVKQRRRSDMGLRYFEPNSRLYKVKACKSAREATNSETNYLDNRSLYFKDMFSEERIRSNQNNTFETWKKFDENMNSENKHTFHDPEKLNFSNHFDNYNEEVAGNRREIKLDEDVETKCPLFNVEEVDSKANLGSNIGSIFEIVDENEVSVIKREEENQAVQEGRPEISTSLIANGEHEYLYSEDAIPTQFEFELEIVDSSVDTYDVSMPDIKELPESNDAVDLAISDDRLDAEFTNADPLPRPLLTNEESSLTDTGQNSCDIKDEIPLLNNLLNTTDINQNHNHLSPSSSGKFSDSISLVQEVLAAKELLRKYLPKCSSSSKPRQRTLAEKKQGAGFSLSDVEKTCLAAREIREQSSLRRHSKNEKKHPRESSRSRENHRRKTSKLGEECEYNQQNTISLRDQKRSSLQSIQLEESNKTKDSASRSKSSDSSSKRSRSSSDSRSQKTKDLSKDGDRSIMKSYRIPKISRFKENGRENPTEPKAKEDMPILEPEGGVHLDPTSDRDASLSPPVITNQDDDIFIEDSKVFNTSIGKEDKVSCNIAKAVQLEPGMTLADAVQKWVFHEKATIKHRRYCVLCERWFPSVIRHRRHLSGYQHRHTELTQRKTIHTLFMLFTGKPCPRLLPADILRPDCSLGEPTPLQIAVQNVALGYEKAHEKSKTKDEESKE